MVPPLLQKNRGTACLRRRLCDDDDVNDDSNAKDRKKNPPFDERRTTMTSEASVVTSFVVKEREFCVSARTPFNGEVMRRFTILPKNNTSVFFSCVHCHVIIIGVVFFFFEHRVRLVLGWGPPGKPLGASDHTVFNTPDLFRTPQLSNTRPG